MDGTEFWFDRSRNLIFTSGVVFSGQGTNGPDVEVVDDGFVPFQLVQFTLGYGPIIYERC